jgi:adenine-specific DNA-methyltransferase
MQKPEPLPSASPELTERLIAQLREAAPQVFVEGKIDFAKLQTALGAQVAEGKERYGLNWAGKGEAFRNVQSLSGGTLAPQLEESVNWDSTGNLIIEGDNLEVLKLLQRPYHGAVKMIYIDPPYNTGNEFIYPDNFHEGLADYLRYSGQVSEEGFAQSSNKETNGRYHSNWLNMMYPRLFLARNLLREDGVIFVSIDDHEVHNLRHLMDEVFGEENFVACLIWEKGRKNDAKLFSVGHEYMLVYVRSIESLKAKRVVWREEKPGARDIWDEYLRLRTIHSTDDRAIEKDLSAWYAALPASNPAKKWSRYKRVDQFGPWRDRDISWPGGDGPRYDVIHPKSKKPCRVPERGWIYSSPLEMKRQIALGLVEFRDDHTEPPFRKAHIRPIDIEIESETNDDSEVDGEFANQVRGSYFYKQSQVSVRNLRALLGEKIFDNPKDHDEIARLIDYSCSSDPDALILDFFAGSGTTAQAVLELNAKDGGNRKFILVQLPEKTENPKFPTIADITRERVRRVIAKLEAEETTKVARTHEATRQAGLLPPQAGELGGGGVGAQNAGVSGGSALPPQPSSAGEGSDSVGRAHDLGFRAFKLAASNFRAWNAAGATTGEGLAEQLALHADHLDASAGELSVVFELMLRAGLPPSSPMKVITLVVGKAARKAFAVNGDEVLICVEAAVSLDLMRALFDEKPKKLVCLDRAFAGDDAAKTNAVLQAKERGITFYTA